MSKEKNNNEFRSCLEKIEDGMLELRNFYAHNSLDSEEMDEMKSKIIDLERQVMDYEVDNFKLDGDLDKCKLQLDAKIAVIKDQEKKIEQLKNENNELIALLSFKDSELSLIEMADSEVKKQYDKIPKFVRSLFGAY